MTDDTSVSGRKRFVEALHVRQNAVRGFGFAAVVTVLVYVLFVGLPVLGGDGLNRGEWFWFLGLGLSMALGLGGLVTTVLVALRARTLSREL